MVTGDLYCLWNRVYTLYCPVRAAGRGGGGVEEGGGGKNCLGDICLYPKLLLS